MTIQAAAVAFQKVILVHDKLTPTLRPKAAKIIESLPRHDHKVSYEHGASVFHCLVEHEISYVAITDSETTTRTAYAFLEDIKNKFKDQFAGNSQSYPNASQLTPTLCAKFGPSLAGQLRFFNENPDSDKIGKLKSKVDDVKQVMLKNIEDVIERGETIDKLVERTDLLQEDAGAFHENATTLRKAMWWRNVKIIIAIVFCVIVLAVIISMFACGADYSKCASEEKPAPAGPPPTTMMPTPVPTPVPTAVPTPAPAA
jgi:vesicle-associated membrane protein 7